MLKSVSVLVTCAIATIFVASCDRTSGDVLRYPVTFCAIPGPAVDVTWFGRATANEIHAGLTRLAAYPAKGFEMELADSYEVDDSGLRYTFRLRPGLEFSDRTPVSAHDFVWSWNRAARQSRHGSSAHTVFDAVVGFNQVAGAWDAEMSGVRATDDETLVIDLVRPVAHFPLLVANPVAAVLSRENTGYWVEAWTNSGAEQPIRFDADSIPTGAGPFKLVEFDGDGCVLERNARYWDESVDVIDRIELMTSALDIEDADLSFLNGDSDADLTRARLRAEGLDPVDVQFETGQIDALTPLFAWYPTVGDDAISVQLGAAELLLLNPLVPPLDNLDFRLALVHASPTLEFEDGRGSRLLPPALADGTTVPGRASLDVGSASEQLRRCECVDKLENPLQFTSNVRVISPGLSPFQSVFKNWKDVLGVQVSEGYEPRPEVELSNFATGDLALRAITVKPSYPQPSAVLDRVLSEIPGLEESAPHLKALSDEAAAEGDAVRSERLYLELEQAILDSGLVIPITSRGTIYAQAKPWVHGLGPVWPGASFFRDVRVADRP